MNSEHQTNSQSSCLSDSDLEMKLADVNILEYENDKKSVSGCDDFHLIEQLITSSKQFNDFRNQDSTV